MVTTTFSYKGGNFPGSGGRSSTEKPLQVVPAPHPVLGCPASAASALQAWRRRLLVRSTAIKYTKKPPRADGRRRRRFMADFSGSGTGSGAMIGSGCSGSWSGTRLGGFRHRHTPAGLPSPAPERSKRGKSKKDETALPKRGKAVKAEQDRAGLQRMEAGQKWNTVFRAKLENFGSQERVRGLEQAKIGKKRPKSGTERSTVPELFRNCSTPRSPYLSTFLPSWNSWNSIYIKRIKIYK